MTITNASELNSAAEIAARATETISKIRSAEGEDAATLAALKPIEETLCFFEVDPGGVTLSELRAAESDATALYHSRGF